MIHKYEAEFQYKTFRSQVVNASLFYDYLMKTSDPNFKGVVLILMDELSHINKKNYKKFTLRVLSEHVITSHSCWAFPKDHFLVEAFDEKILAFRKNGLLNFLAGKYMDPKYITIKRPKIGPRKLNLEHLEGGFKVWFCGIFSALFLFILEVLTSQFVKIDCCPFTIKY
ncbi:CLUMA_CG004580, isoform A [Clunio marinus]|uniref:CLUMA_CG004580, isoform A n=1 Tax=Clunio marinus TaxID=568069 RepID=A0A1J1HSD3_9DIPT|nr:CLUMA_CG004580, isoform A [Clunio marinus]